jgi:hypothetical protein
MALMFNTLSILFFSGFLMSPTSYHLGGKPQPFLYRTIYFSHGQMVQDEKGISSELGGSLGLRYPEYCALHFVYAPAEVTHPFLGEVDVPEVKFDLANQMTVKARTEKSVSIELKIENRVPVYNVQRHLLLTPYHLRCVSAAGVADSTDLADFKDLIENNVPVSVKLNQPIDFWNHYTSPYSATPSYGDESELRK